VRNQSKATTFLAIFCVSSLFADTLKPNGCKGPNLCSSYPLTDGCSWQFDVGLLYQQMRVSSGQIATAVVERNYSEIPIGAQDYVNFTNNILRFGFDVDPGLKIGAGFYFEQEKWFLSANFEWLRSQATFTVDASPPIYYRPYGYPSVSVSVTDQDYPISFQDIDASLSVDYFLLDVCLAKGSYFSNSFTFEPFAGVQSSWISYYTKNLFTNDLNTDGSILPEDSAWSFITKVNFWGVGPEIGLNSSYYMFGGWSVYSMMNAAAIFGQTNFLNMNGIVTLIVDPTYNHTSDQNNVICPTARAILGLQYDKNTYCDKQHLRLRLGFDARYVLNQFPVVNYEGQFPYTSGNTFMFTAPIIQENNAFGMVGLILDIAYDF
jgi:hypothetical protein